MRRWVRSRRARGWLFPGIFLAAALVGFGAGQASTASNAVPATNIGQSAVQPISPAQLEPAWCTSSDGTVTSVEVVGSGTTLSASAADQLLLGKNGDVTLADSGHYGGDCMVGGEASTHDTLSGWKHGHTLMDYCIADYLTVTAGTVTNCNSDPTETPGSPN